jgi:hypothetical protein
MGSLEVGSAYFYAGAARGEEGGEGAEAPIEAATRNGRDMADWEQTRIEDGVRAARAEGASMVAGVGRKRG